MLFLSLAKRRSVRSTINQRVHHDSYGTDCASVIASSTTALDSIRDIVLVNSRLVQCSTQ